MRYFIDSNIFIRFFSHEGNNQIFRSCSKLIDLISKNKIQVTTSHLVIAEVVWTLSSSYKATKDQPTKATELIEYLPGIKIIDKFQTQIAHGFFKNHGVKYIDALIASIPQLESGKWTIISYDKDFDKLGVKRIEPLALLSS